VLTELMAEEVDDVVGPKGRHDAERVAVRHGHEDGSVTLGGRRVPVQRPRARATDGSGEIAMTTYGHFADRDSLTKVVLEQMLAGVSTRRFARSREPVGQDVIDAEHSTSKSAVSREFVGRTGEHLRALMARSLEDVRLVALMLDGLELKGRCCVVALGTSTDGVKVPLGCGMARRRTSASASNCSRTSSIAAWTATRVCSSSWMAARRCGPPSMRSSVTSPSSAA